jgi:EAL domain-containing protein (putative c-di-GMP-specific phosphodiesterase class I)
MQELPIDVIKIDRGFAEDLGTVHRGDAIVTALLQLAQNVGATCVAEGAATSTQRDILARSGCPLTQGYLFAGPCRPPSSSNFSPPGSHSGARPPFSW